MSSYRDRLINHYDGERIADALEASAGVNSTMSTLEKQIASMFAAKRTGKTWRTRFYKYATNQTSAGTKMDDNADMAIPTPATDSVEGVDPYLEYGVFQWMRCNYKRDDSDGFARPTALKGWPGYAEEGAVDVGTLRMTFWWNIEIHATYYDFVMSDVPQPGLVPWCDAVKIDADENKTVMPYFIESAFNSVTASDGLPRSQPGPSAYNQNYNEMITAYAKKGTGYHGAGASRNALQILWLAIKYATKNSQNYFAGCTDYNTQVAVALAETGVKRVLLPSGTTGFFAGGCVSVGDRGSNTTTDRHNNLLNNLCNRVKVASVETVTVNSTSYVALNLDIDSTIDTTTTCIVSTMPQWSGDTDHVIGIYDGSPRSNTNGKNSYRIGGIEYMNGQAVIASDVVMEFNSDYTKNIYCAERPTTHVANAHTNYKLVGKIRKAGDLFIGDEYIDLSTGCSVFGNPGGGDSVGVGDFIWGGGNGSGLREYYMGGYLGHARLAGAACVNCRYDLSNGNWDYGSCD